MYICKDCFNGFDSPAALGGHRNWCEKNTSISGEKRTQRIKDWTRKSAISNTVSRKQVTLACAKCNKPYTLKLRETELTSGRYTKHCSRACANSRVKTATSKKKTSETLRQGYASGRIIRSGFICEPRYVAWRCKNCDKQEQKTKTAATNKTCGKECARQLASKRMSERIKSGKHGQQSIKCVYTFKGVNIRCDSKLEYACVHWFETIKSAVSVERCVETICYMDFNNKQRRYTPDFIVKTNDCAYLVECKNHAIGKSLNKKWHLYKQLIPFKQKALEHHAQKNGMIALWFTPKMHNKFYISLFGKDMNNMDR